MDFPSPGNLRLTANRILTCFIVTHPGINTSGTRYHSFRCGLYLFRNALLPLQINGARCFGVWLTPDHYRYQNARPVSYYALFKWWLLLSQHPGCHRTLISFVTKQDFGALAGDLGCFPLDREASPSRTNSRDSRHGIRSLVTLGRWVTPHANSVALPP